MSKKDLSKKSVAQAAAAALAALAVESLVKGQLVIAGVAVAFSVAIYAGYEYLNVKTLPWTEDELKNKAREAAAELRTRDLPDPEDLDDLSYRDLQTVAKTLRQNWSDVDVVLTQAEPELRSAVKDALETVLKRYGEGSR